MNRYHNQSELENEFGIEIDTANGLRVVDVRYDEGTGSDVLQYAFDDYAADSPLVFGAISQVFSTTIVMASAVPAVVSVPEWLHTSFIGCAWGGLTIAGLMCSWSRQRLASCLFAVLLSVVAHSALSVLVDLDHNACWLVVVCVVASGWGVGSLLTPWQAETRVPTRFSSSTPSCETPSYQRSSCKTSSNQGLLRWSLWDIAGLATSVAALCWLVPRVQHQLHLILQIAPALLAGALISLLAVEWAWRDRWSIKRLCAVALGLLAGIGACWWSAPEDLSLGAMLLWLLAGPASVVAAQGLTVLGYMACVRLDTHLTHCQADR